MVRKVQYSMTACNTYTSGGSDAQGCTLNNWHNYIVSYNNNTIYVYVDGVYYAGLGGPVASQPFGLNANVLTFGSRYVNFGSGNFIGWVADIAFWTYSIDYCDAWKVFNGAPLNTTTPPVGYWRGRRDGEGQLLDEVGETVGVSLGSGPSQYTPFGDCGPIVVPDVAQCDPFMPAEPTPQPAPEPGTGECPVCAVCSGEPVPVPGRDDCVSPVVVPSPDGYLVTCCPSSGSALLPSILFLILSLFVLKF